MRVRAPLVPAARPVRPARGPLGPGAGRAAPVPAAAAQWSGSGGGQLGIVRDLAGRLPGRGARDARGRRDARHPRAPVLARPAADRMDRDRHFRCGWSSPIPPSSTWASMAAVRAHHRRLDLARSGRFRADSELALARSGGGTAVPVGEMLADAPAVALDAAEATDGDLDLDHGHSQMATLGYDRDFQLVARDGSPVRLTKPWSGRAGGGMSG